MSEVISVQMAKKKAATAAFPKKANFRSLRDQSMISTRSRNSLPALK